MTDYTSEIDGHEVVGRRLKVTKAGDGLSESLKIEARDLHVGEHVTLVLRGVVTKPRFVPADKDDPDGDYEREDTIEALGATIVEDAVVRGIMDTHTERIAELRALEKEARENIKRLPFDTAEDMEQAAEDRVDPATVRNIRRMTDDDDEAKLAELRKFDTETLAKHLGKIGAEVTELELDLEGVKHKRMLVFEVLEERAVSYRRMAAMAGNMSDVAVLKGLQRHHRRKAPTVKKVKRQPKNPEPVV